MTDTYMNEMLHVMQDNQLNILIYGIPFCVIIHTSYQLLEVVAPPPVLLNRWRFGSVAVHWPQLY